MDLNNTSLLLCKDHQWKPRTCSRSSLCLTYSSNYSGQRPSCIPRSHEGLLARALEKRPAFVVAEAVQETTLLAQGAIEPISISGDASAFRRLYIC